MISDITQVRLEHREDIVNRLLQEGWVLLCEPFIGLRRVERAERAERVETNSDNSPTYLIDIPWREFVLGHRRD
ncbi:hypothetical protein ES703_60309 [subsurface metagenome]